MKILIFSLACSLFVFTTITKVDAQKQAGDIKWEVLKSSSLTVDGKTNISSFSCSLGQYSEKDTLIWQKGITKEIILSGELQMEVVSFNCHNTIMTKELRKTIKSIEYPLMTIHFLSLESMPLFNSKTEMIKGWVEVTLAGVIKKFEVNFLFHDEADKTFKLNGNHTFLFSDFKLVPPKKLGGLIKIKDDFDVNFQLQLKIV